MGGEVHASRLGPGIRKGVPRDRLKRVARAAARMAVVHDQRRAALPDEPLRQLPDHCDGSGRGFDDGAGLGGCKAGRHGRSRHPLEAAVAPGHQQFLPPAGSGDELPDRERV
jgi:hypothetical protein